MEYLKQFQTHISNNNLPSMVSLWQEYCLSDEVDIDELISVLESIKASSLAEPFGCYAEQILPLWESLEDGPKSNTVFRLVFDLQTTGDSQLAECAYSYLEKHYGNHKNFQQKIRLVGLREKESFRYCISNFERLSHMEVGNFFVHTGGWGVGEVTDVSMLREQISLEFDYVAGTKELSFANAFKTLVPITKDHFLAMRFGDPDTLEKKSKEDPIFVLRALLQDLGPMTASEIKDELCELVIPENDWQKWWQTARTRAKKDTLIEVPETIREPFRLRSTEITHEERLQKSLGKKPDVDTLIEMVYSFVRDFPTSLKNESFKESLQGQLQEVLSNAELNDGQEFQILLLLLDINESSEIKLGEIVSNFTNPQDVIGQIAILAYRKRFLVEVRANRKDWAEVFQELFLTIDQNPIRDYILSELLSADKLPSIVEKLEQLLQQPNLYPQAFLWYFRKILTSKTLPFADQEGKNRFLEAFFVLLHILEPLSNARDLVKKMHQFLSADRYAAVRHIFQGASKSVLQEILLLSTKCYSLNDHDIKILYSLAEVVEPSIGKLHRSSPESEEEVLWTTQEGYNKLKERIHEIATVETVENVKEIEIARSHGDLRENSEFKFALEKRDRLQSEMKFLSDQLNAMRVITKEDIKTDEISVGTIVHFENAKGESISYTFLGPWDADPEKHVLSFQSKLAKSLLGLTPGKECTIHGEKWKVSHIHSFLETK